MTPPDSNEPASDVPSQPEPFWPIEPPRLDDAGLESWVLDYVAGGLFTSAMLPSYSKGGPSFSDEFGSVWPFWALALEGHGTPPDTYSQSIGVFYSKVADARAFDQTGKIPTFIQVPKVLHREDWEAACKAIASVPDAPLVPAVPDSPPPPRSRREIVQLLEHIRADQNLTCGPAQLWEPELGTEQGILQARIEVLQWVLGQVEHAGGIAGDPK